MGHEAEPSDDVDIESNLPYIDSSNIDEAFFLSAWMLAQIPLRIGHKNRTHKNRKNVTFSLQLEEAS